MTMQHQTHPDDERLAALAGGDPEATGDGRLTAHVDDCAQCAALVGELSTLRSALAELPDVPPSRPLVFLPPVVGRESFVDRLGVVVRRLFAPALTAGAALALVGAVGTVNPNFGFGAASMPELTGGEQSAERDAAAIPSSLVQPMASHREGLGGVAIESPSPDDSSEFSAGAGGEASADPTPVFRSGDDGQAEALNEQLPAPRSIWPMVLFAGVALMIGALLARWILQPGGTRPA
jgi:hypothetical protein